MWAAFPIKGKNQRRGEGTEREGSGFLCRRPARELGSQGALLLQAGGLDGCFPAECEVSFLLKDRAGCTRGVRKEGRQHLPQAAKAEWARNGRPPAQMALNLTGDRRLER